MILLQGSVQGGASGQPDRQPAAAQRAKPGSGASWATDFIESFESNVAFDVCYRTLYQAVQASLADNKPLRSALFWEWTFPGNVRGDRGVETNDTTFE